MEFYFEINAKISRLIRFIYFMECHTRNFFQGRKNEFVIWKDGNVENVKLKENKIIKYRMKDFYTLIFFFLYRNNGFWYYLTILHYFCQIYLLDRRHLLEGLSWRQHRCFVHPRFRIQDRCHHWSDLLPQLVPIPCSATTVPIHKFNMMYLVDPPFIIKLILSLS